MIPWAENQNVVEKKELTSCFSSCGWILCDFADLNLCVLFSRLGFYKPLATQSQTLFKCLSASFILQWCDKIVFDRPFLNLLTIKSAKKMHLNATDLFIWSHSNYYSSVSATCIIIFLLVLLTLFTIELSDLYNSLLKAPFWGKDSDPTSSTGQNIEGKKHILRLFWQSSDGAILV